MSRQSLYARLRSSWRASRRKEPGTAALTLNRVTHCPICRYDLQGLPERHVCPECAFQFEADMLEFRLGGREIWQLRLIFGLGIVLPLSVLALVAAKTRGMGFILPGSVVTTFAIYVLLFGFAFLLLSRPDWAIVRSDAIIWRRSIFPMRTLRWLDVGDVALVPGDVFSIFDRAGRRVRRLSQIILGLKGKVEIGVVTDELQRRWLTCVDRHLRSTEASCVAPEPDAGAIRKLMDLGTPSRCPACRGPLTREANGAVLCTRRTHAWPSGTLLFPAVARPVDRLKVLWVL